MSLCAQGVPGCAPLEARKLCVLETESCDSVNTFKRKFNKGNENKIPVLWAQPIQIVCYERTSPGHGIFHRPSLWPNTVSKVLIIVK